MELLAVAFVADEDGIAGDVAVVEEVGVAGEAGVAASFLGLLEESRFAVAVSSVDVVVETSCTAVAERLPCLSC